MRKNGKNGKKRKKQEKLELPEIFCFNRNDKNILRLTFHIHEKKLFVTVNVNK